MNAASQILSPHTEAIITNLQYQGSSNDCGPFTTAMVLNALLDLRLDGKQLARKMDKPVWRGPYFIIRRVPKWATFPWGIVDIMREYGLNASWRLFGSVDHLLQILPQEKIVMPIIGSLKPLWAHVMTLVAWDAHKGWGFANTQFSHPNIHWVSEDYFNQHWKVMARLYVVANRT
jgi:hypothetical protein